MGGRVAALPTEGRRGLRSWDKGYNGNRGVGGGFAVTEHKDTKGRGDNGLLEQRVARTSSQSIEPSGRALHGREVGSIQILELRKKNTNTEVVYYYEE